MATDLVMLGQGGKSRGLIGDDSVEDMTGDPDAVQSPEAGESGAAAHRAGRPRMK